MTDTSAGSEVKRGRGRPPKAEAESRDADRLRRLKNGINEYFSICEAEDRFPDFAGLRLHLNMTKTELNELCDPSYNENYKAYRREFDIAADRRESWLARKAGEGVNVQGALNLLKEGANGGYQKPEKDHAIVRITIDGRDAIKGGFNVLGK